MMSIAHLYGDCFKRWLLFSFLIVNYSENIAMDVNGTVLNSDEKLAALNLFEGYPSALLDFATAACILFMVVGIPGNLITVISLARYKKVRNATAIFIINLSFCDFLYCCVNLPLSASTFYTRRWYHGVFMCKFFPFMRFALAGVSIFTIVAITINRYIMISHSRLYTKIYTSRNLGIIVTFTWLLTFTLLTPICTESWGTFGMDAQASFCVVMPNSSGHSPEKFLFVFAFVVPFITISFCYARIFWIVRKTTANSHGAIRKSHQPEDSSMATSSPDSDTPDPHTFTPENPPEQPRVQSLRVPPSPNVKISVPDERSSHISSIVNFGKTFNLRKSQLLDKAAPTSKDKRLLTMITGIMLTFFVCYTPITIIKVFHEISDPTPVAIVLSYLLRYLTCCLNPLIYVVLSKEYRKAYRKMLVLPSCKNKSCDFWR